MSRFNKKKRFKFKSIYVAILVFFVLMLVFMMGVSIMKSSNGDRQEQALNSAMERDIMHCYALEGFYPPSIEYMEAHYGLTYDKSAYIVDYQPVGNNIYPNYTIIKKGEKR